MNDTFRVARLGLTAVLIVAILSNPSDTIGADEIPFEGEKTAWRGGFDRYDFVMDEKTLAIEPFRPVIVKEGEGHYPLAPKDPKAIADLIAARVS